MHAYDALFWEIRPLSVRLSVVRRKSEVGSRGRGFFLGGLWRKRRNEKLIRNLDWNR